MAAVRAAVVVAMATTVLALDVDPAAACSCAAVDVVPNYDFTGVVVEDLGYADTDSNAGLGEARAWLLDVTEARRGVEEGEVRISMLVGQIVNEDGSGSIGGCGLDDNLIVGETYNVTSVGLENMETCGSQVDGPRSEVPVGGDDDDDERLWDLLVIFGTGAIVLLLAGILVVRTGRRS